jgi:ABC-type dipeptide/oligopeptide/nickel transport system permease subunit
MFTQTETTHHMTGGVVLSILVILAMTLLALLAPKIAPYDPKQMQAGLSNYPPAWYDNAIKPGRSDHLLGTDLFGRDILSRAIHGARSAMFLVVLTIPLAILIGAVVGVLAGMGNKFIADLFQRISDVASSVPSFMFAVIIVFILRSTPTGRIYGGIITLTLAFALVNWVSLARLIYTSVMTVKHQEFMEASRSLGAGKLHQVFKHILPHVSHLIITWAVINIPAVILLEALFGYIGVDILRVTDGSSFQDISWGGLILNGRNLWHYNPFVLLLPTLCILAISMSFATLGEYLNERMNPKFKSNQIL